MYNIEELRIRLLSELKEIAEELGVKNSKTLKKDELVYAILDQQAILPEQALPKKKPSVVENQLFNQENSENQASSASAASEVPEYKPKFRRQNVTELPASPSAEETENSNPSSENEAPKPYLKPAKEFIPKGERKHSNSFSEESKGFKPRRKVFEDQVPKP